MHSERLKGEVLIATEFRPRYGAVWPEPQFRLGAGSELPTKKTCQSDCLNPCAGK